MREREREGETRARGEGDGERRRGPAVDVEQRAGPPDPAFDYRTDPQLFGAPAPALSTASPSRYRPLHSTGGFGAAHCRSLQDTMIRPDPSRLPVVLS